MTCITVIVFIVTVLPIALGQAEQNLVAYWPLDGNTNDASGNGHDGDLQGDAEWVLGKYGQALDFGSGGGYVIVPDDDELDLSTAVTYMGWFNLNDPISGQRRMMSKNDSIFLLFDFGAAQSLDFLVKPNNSFAESTTIFELGEWYHFAGTYDGSSLRMYINGEMEGESGGVPSITTSDLELWIGADDYTLPETSFPGILDDIRIYNRDLTQGEIEEAMSGPRAVQMTGEKLSTTWGLMKSAN
jgi:hypothetical protein